MTKYNKDGFPYVARSGAEEYDGCLRCDGCEKIWGAVCVRQVGKSIFCPECLESRRRESK